MMHRTVVLSVLLLATLGCGGLAGGGLSSAECVKYFEVVETCAAKAEAKGTPAGKAKAEAWRKSAEVSRENFEKNPSAPAIAASCEAMIPAIENDPDCK